ncbi:MAG: type II toxin-antitoxin system RelE/ParE family toxin [Flavobacterium sp.]|nr:type II toxin-antitoxin system RelE/ParE family toxin [Flavobacterium sp.]
MSYAVVNHIEVKNDVLQVKDWYKTKQKGLEKRFANEVKSTLNYLIKNPLLFQIKYKTLRTAYTEIFPYAVHYHFNEKSKTITVLGVFYTSISPDKWLIRL